MLGMLCWIGLLLGWPAQVWAADLHTVLANLRSVVNPLIVLTLAISFCAGIWMIFRGILMLKRFGMTQQQMSHQEVSHPLINILVGTVLVYLPTSTNVISKTLFTEGEDPFGAGQINFDTVSPSGELLGYFGSGFDDKWGDLVQTLLLYVQFIGFIAFVRGWFILARSTQQGGHDSVGKAMTHIIAGIIAINFTTAITIVKNTLYGG